MLSHASLLLQIHIYQIRSDYQMGVEKPALAEKPTFKLSLNEVVRDGYNYPIVLFDDCLL